MYYNNELIRLETWQKRYAIKGEISDFFSDGVHPSMLTYQIWGKDMANYIMKTQSFKEWMRRS